LAVDDCPAQLCLNAIILGDEWIVERLFDENGSKLAVRHRTILAVLWVLVASV
jgi:hypothetical protein